MRLLLSGDWHFNLRPTDQYKFKLFDILLDLYEQSVYDHLVFLGDLTDEKDKHSSELVDKIYKGFLRLFKADIPILMIYWNHDFIEASRPFFQFLQLLPNIRYFQEPTTLQWAGKTGRFIPWTTNPEYFEPADYCFTHLTLDGCIAESGFKMESRWAESFFAERYKHTFSGDIHKPQTIGSFSYVGAPYHNRFGDQYDGQFLLLDVPTGRVEIIPLVDHFPKKLKLDVSTLHKARDIDLVKVSLKITNENAVTWSAVKQELEEKGYQVEPVVELATIEKGEVLLTESNPMQVLEEFCRIRNLEEEFLNVARSLLNG
jgi:DNA repair exonuclease SbcCD nuclease subunit